MLNNKLCLTSVVEFLRRGRVDRGTGGGKVVVVVDLSKRKVQWALNKNQKKHHCRHCPRSGRLYMDATSLTGNADPAAP